MELLANRLGRQTTTAKSLVMRQPSAALRGTRFLAYLIDMSRCSVPCALHLAVLATFFNILYMQVRIKQETIIRFML